MLTIQRLPLDGRIPNTSRYWYQSWSLNVLSVSMPLRGGFPKNSEEFFSARNFVAPSDVHFSVQKVRTRGEIDYFRVLILSIEDVSLTPRRCHQAWKTEDTLTYVAEFILENRHVPNSGHFLSSCFSPSEDRVLLEDYQPYSLQDLIYPTRRES